MAVLVGAVTAIGAAVRIALVVAGTAPGGAVAHGASPALVGAVAAGMGGVVSQVLPDRGGAAGAAVAALLAGLLTGWWPTGSLRWSDRTGSRRSASRRSSAPTTPTAACRCWSWPVPRPHCSDAPRRSPLVAELAAQAATQSSARPRATPFRTARGPGGRFVAGRVAGLARAGSARHLDLPPAAAPTRRHVLGAEIATSATGAVLLTAAALATRIGTTVVGAPLGLGAAPAGPWIP